VKKEGLLKVGLILFFPLSPVQLHYPFFVPFERVLISFREMNDDKKMKLQASESALSL
jgi:hypothetical protein